MLWYVFADEMLCCLLGLSAPLMCSPLANLLIKKKNSKSFQTWLARSFASCLHWRFASAELSSRSSAAFQQHMIFVLVFRVGVLAGSTIKQPRQDVDQHRPLATQPCLFSAPYAGSLGSVCAPSAGSCDDPECRYAHNRTELKEIPGLVQSQDFIELQ